MRALNLQVLLLWIFLAVVLPSTLIAQGINLDCDVCAPPDTLHHPNTWFQTTIAVGSGCAVQVHYSTNKCMPSGCHVLSIDRMSFIGEGCELYCPWELFALVVGTMITDNTINFPFDSLAEKECLLLAQPRCWRRHSGYDTCFISENYYERYIPCDMDECCFMKIELSPDGCGQWLLADVDTSVVHDYYGSEVWEAQMGTEPCDVCMNPGPPIPNPSAPADCRDDHVCYWSCKQDLVKRFLTMQRKFVK